MPARQTPVDKAKLTGTYQHNKGRFEERFSIKQRDVGSPPAHLTKAQKAAWRAFKDEFPWLKKSDRAALVGLCKLRVEIEDSEEPVTATIREYRMQLSAFGGTPTSLGNVYQPPEPPKDPEDDSAGKPVDPLSAFVQ